MNNTNFTISDLRKVIPILVYRQIGITISSSKFNKDLVEFSKRTDIVINSATENNDVIDIEFQQEFNCESEDFECEIYEYRTLVEVKDIKNILNEINN